MLSSMRRENMTRVLIVDDHEVVLEGLQTALSAMPAVEIVGLAADGAEALQLARRTVPELALVDFRLPDMPGDRLCARLLQTLPSLRVVMLTTYVSEDIVRRTLDAGACRFVTKAAGLDELRRAIDSVLVGDPIPTGGSATVVAHLQQLANEQSSATLTSRQERVLELAAAGMTYAEIGQRLFISESTVRFHIQALKTKLGARTKTQLIATAIRAALIDPVGTGELAPA
jgi:DNA-binding NarL/FixJ family response regulator